MAPMIGMMTSPTSEVTIAPKAAPMMTPTARSTTLPFIANSRNSFSICSPFSSASRTGRLMADRSWRTDLGGQILGGQTHDDNDEGLVDQAGIDHGIADHLAGWRRHRHQRQAHLFLQPSQQLEAMLGSGEARLLEDRVMQ